MPKKVLITAGATEVRIDQVRAITNIFKGRTGLELAKHFKARGYEVTLLTSSPKEAKRRYDGPIIPYRDYDELTSAMYNQITGNCPDIIIHSAAVSDYKCDGVFEDTGGQLKRLDASKKVSSSHKELFLRMLPTEKIIDKIKRDWGFKGILVKFKLEVGISDEDLIVIAQNSRTHSDADLIVANCLEWSRHHAYIISEEENKKVVRNSLGEELTKYLEEKK